MSIDVTDLVMDRYFINELNKDILNKNKELNERWKELRRKCFHPTTETTSKYDRGGYDYISSITITKKCTLCDTVLECYNDPNHRGSYS